jgi:hypothetical protein
MKIKVRHVTKGKRSSYSNHRVHESYQERIDYLTSEIEKLEHLKKIHDYFKHVARCKNSYVVEMRRIVAMGLFARNFSLSEVTRAICRSSHATVIHLKTVRNFDHVEQEVIHNYQRWMIDRVYPVTYYIVSVDPKTKRRNCTPSYKLKPIER